MLNCTAHDVGDVLIITLDSPTESQDDRLASHRQTLYQTIQGRTAARCAIDLGRVDFASSADIGFLVSIRRRIDAVQGALVLFGVGTYIRETLETMRLLPLFPVADDLNGAIRLLTTLKD